jgi:hypothetical protein
MVAKSDAVAKRSVVGAWFSVVRSLFEQARLKASFLTFHQKSD